MLQSALFKGGRPLLVNHWATWCDGCVEELPELVELHSQIADKVDFLGVSWDGFQGGGEAQQLCRWVESEPGAAPGLAVGSDAASAAPLQPDPPPALAPGTELEEYETNDVDGSATVKLSLRMPTVSECSTLLAAGAPDSLRVTCSAAMLLANPSAKRRKTVECIG